MFDISFNGMISDNKIESSSRRRRMRRISVFILVHSLILHHLGSSSLAFVLVPSSIKHTSSSKGKDSSYTRNQNDSFTSSSQLYATLKFHGTKTFHTKPLPIDSIDTLQILFGSSSTLKDLAKIAMGGSSTDYEDDNNNNNDKVTILPHPIDPSLMDQWKMATKSVNATPPDDRGFICKVQTSGLNFSGLQVKTVANIGTQLLQLQHDDTDTNDTFQLEFTYIDDEQIVQGPKILVSIFNVLTGKKDSDDEAKKNKGQGQRVQSLSRLSTTVSNDTVVFHLDTCLDISIQFPTVLLKILPVSKEKAEEQGSEAIMKTLIKDTEAMIPKLEQFYLQLYYENSRRKEQKNT